MTLTTPYSATFIVGDGETKTFSYLFEEVSPNFISVMVYNSLTGLISTPTYVIDTDQKQVIFGDDTPAPTADETVCIYRNTPNVQDVAFRTLHGYDAQTLENILSKIVAMIQEIKSNYFSTQVLQGDPWQLDLLSSEDDGATVNIDYTAKKLVKGLYFRITSGNLQVSADGVTYLALPKSDDVAEFRQYEQTLPDLTVIRKLQYRVGNQWFDAEANAQYTADEAYALAESVQTTMSAHINNTQNPHQTSLNNLTDTDISDLQNGQFISYVGGKWKNVASSATAYWGGILGNITDQTDLQNALNAKVNTDGTSIITGPLLMRATQSFKCAIAPYWDGVGFFKLNDNDSVTLMASIEYNSGFEPATANTYNIGASARKWKNLYLAGKAYVATINNGADLSVPNKSGTLATMGDVELAARSGRMLTDQGKWYAKMYSSSTVPTGAEYDGRNYADFSQVDSDNNPIIVIYEGQNGNWVQSETITPPAEYDGYVSITSKIWDIVEQSGQQGGRVLWNHTSKEFTPEPRIISTNDIEVTGDSTVIMPQNPGANQIVNKDYVDDAIAAIPTPRVDVLLSPDIKIVGSLTQNGSAFSGFSSANYLALPWGPVDLTEPFEFVIGAKFTGGTLNQSIAHTVVAHNGIFNLFYKADTGEIKFQGVGGGVEISGAVSTNTNYLIKVSWSGTEYKLFVSTDNGDTYTQLGSTVSSTSDCGYGDQMIIGKDGGTQYYESLQGEINLGGSYFKINENIVWAGMDSPGLAQRVMKGHEVIAFQAPTSGNNYTWYRKYADGWVEQGGIVDNGSSTTTWSSAVTFPVEMSDTNYSYQVTPKLESFNTNGCAMGAIYQNTTTGFTLEVTSKYSNAGNTQQAAWRVEGMAAS